MDHFNDPDSNADVISKKVQMDQVISAKVLRLGNSARYGAGRKIASIDSAVVMLGLDALKTLVVASGVTGAFKSIPGVDKKVFWRNTFMVANIAKLVAKRAKVDPEIAFTCGMFHNIGELLLCLHDSDKCKKINELVASGAKRIDLQENQFTVNYCQVGAELAKRWKFPEEIQDAILLQETPDENTTYATILYLAKYLNNAISLGKSQEEVLSDFPIKVVKPLGVDLVALFEDVLEMMQQNDDIDELLKD
ncbi:MAG: HDOD domain-containing protein [Hahellaceae bacterium]|nr:HDOD domain-containing protein [Hahellaceae bacterium]MCP5210051.1 HDOD domain-containing protein [Hahellaceae bacterium]